MKAESWKLIGKVLVACTCDWGCPCNFNARLPEGIIFKQGDLGRTARFRVVTQGIPYDHSGQYLAVGPFDYAGP